jgi:hypothetical protein
MRPIRFAALLVPFVASTFGIACGHGRAINRVELHGTVTDPNGAPVPGVTVTAPGALAATTDAQGAFRLRANNALRIPVSFTSPRFVRTTRFLRAATIVGNGVVIWPRAATVTIDAARGGVVPLGSGGAIDIPPNALVDERGRTVSGPASVSATYLDVSDPAQLAAVPGDFSARMRNGTERRLESFGVFSIDITDASGGRLDFARGRPAAVRIPIPRDLVDGAPRSTSSFTFDPSTGQWIEEGTFTLDGLVYTGTIDRTDWSWNADDPMDTTCMTFKVVRPWQGNLPEANAHVVATGVNYASVSSGYTDANGLVCLLVKRNAPIQVQAFSTQVQNYVSVPVTITSPNVASGAADCGNPVTCPLTTINLDIIVGGGGAEGS